MQRAHSQFQRGSFPKNIKVYVKCMREILDEMNNKGKKKKVILTEKIMFVQKKTRISTKTVQLQWCNTRGKYYSDKVCQPLILTLNSHCIWFHSPIRCYSLFHMTSTSLTNLSTFCFACFQHSVTYETYGQKDIQLIGINSISMLKSSDKSYCKRERKQVMRW